MSFIFLKIMLVTFGSFGKELMVSLLMEELTTLGQKQIEKLMVPVID